MNILLTTAAAVLLVPVAVFCAECLAALLLPRPRRSRKNAAPDAPNAPNAPRPRVAVLIPAHDEEAGIAATLRTIVPQLRTSGGAGGDRVLVVADNCRDRTADVARGEGCEVVERHDAQRRGKGYALDAGLRHLAANGPAPDVVVMMDADCAADAGTVDALARQVADTNAPAQAVYLMTQPAAGGGAAAADPTRAISALAFLVKNHVRPRGLARLGLPCLLTGTGMAFPWPVIRDAPLASGNIVEDMQLGLDLALAGHAPRFCEDAFVTGQLPGGAKAAYGQRTRWEHGHLRTLLRQAPRLLKAGLFRGRPALIALALELSVPPLSLLIALLGAALSLAIVAGVLGASWLPASMLAGGLALLGACVLLAWARFGRQTIPLTSLLAAPLYVLWKLPMYATFLRRGGEKKWVRTERDSSTAIPAGTSSGTAVKTR